MWEELIEYEERFFQPSLGANMKKHKNRGLSFLLSLMVMTALWAAFPVCIAAEGPGDPAQLSKQPDQGREREDLAARQVESGKVGEPPGIAETSIPADTLTISLRDFLKMMMDKNEEIQVKHLEWGVSEERVNVAKSIYEPYLTASVEREKNHVQNTTEERINRNLEDEFREYNNLWKAAIEGLTPLGGTYRLGYDMDDLSNSLANLDAQGWQRREPFRSEYRTFFGVKLTQPLLKGAGIRATNAEIHITEANALLSFQSYRQYLIETTARAIQLYWQYYGARQKLDMRERSRAIAADLLEMNRKRYEAGKIDYTGVLVAEVGLKLREALAVAAEQTLLTGKRNLLTLIAVPKQEAPKEFLVTDTPESEPYEPDYEACLTYAYQNRSEYLSALRKIERETIRLAFAENQKLPQLDLKASYGLNGLEDSYSDSWQTNLDGDYVSWTVGLQLKVPLFGGKGKKSEVLAAKMRKRQALKELKAIEVKLTNEVDTAIGLVQRALQQVKNYQEVVTSNGELWKVEEARFHAGKSNSRTLLDREEDYLKARESLLDSRLAYQFALSNLKASEGTLLKEYGIEVEYAYEKKEGAGD